MKKIFATAALAVVLSAGAAAPAFAGDNQANSDSQTNSTHQTNHGNPGALNGNQLHVGSVQVPVNVSCNAAAVSAVGNATGAAKDCEKPAPSKPAETTPAANKLPVTGASTGIIAGAAAVMLVGGIFAVRVARRRGRHAGAAA